MLNIPGLEMRPEIKGPQEGHVDLNSHIGDLGYRKYRWGVKKKKKMRSLSQERPGILSRLSR